MAPLVTSLCSVPLTRPAPASPGIPCGCPSPVQPRLFCNDTSFAFIQEIFTVGRDIVSRTIKVNLTLASQRNLHKANSKNDAFLYLVNFQKRGAWKQCVFSNCSSGTGTLRNPRSGLPIRGPVRDEGLRALPYTTRGHAKHQRACALTLTSQSWKQSPKGPVSHKPAADQAPF